LLIGGVLIGPHVLGLAETSNIQLLANIGLGFLFLLAGYELDPQLLRQRPGKLAILGWLISAVVAVGATARLGAAGYIKGLRAGRAGADHHGAGHSATCCWPSQAGSA
jgi:Kef-type K+ transport system membrane component KefB